MNAIRFTGDEWAIPITINVGKVSQVIPTGANVRAILTTDDANPTAIPKATVVDVLEAQAGSDWANGVVVPVFDTSYTALLEGVAQSAKILVKVDDVSYLSTEALDIKRGLIT